MLITKYPTKQNTPQVSPLEDLFAHLIATIYSSKESFHFIYCVHLNLTAKIHHHPKRLSFSTFSSKDIK